MAHGDGGFGGVLRVCHGDGERVRIVRFVVGGSARLDGDLAGARVQVEHLIEFRDVGSADGIGEGVAMGLAGGHCAHRVFDFGVFVQSEPIRAVLLLPLQNDTALASSWTCQCSRPC